MWSIDVGNWVRVGKPGAQIVGEITAITRPDLLPRLRAETDHAAERLDKIGADRVVAVAHKVRQGHATVELSYWALRTPAGWCDLAGEPITLEPAERVQ